ncbi:MAG TPA: galactose-1-phosphate uridylyltransferase [Thermodesulfobacteriota bacterium]|nr:galactose-1-phosphate uridylyltransferase [Thermodesulfobacteriota bacterium]
MPELRLNLLTREWVVISTERTKEPSEFKRLESKIPRPPYLKTCPFCPGNEHRTPEELLRVSEDDGWKIRVVANKYPALSRAGERRRMIDGARRLVTGVGLHEVIIESPLHNTSPAFLDVKYVEDIIRIYRDRLVEAYNDERVEHVIIFKNHGLASGTSIEHPHSQLVATPIVPVRFRDRVLAAMHYFDDTGECLTCDMLRMEREDGRRVIIDSSHFLTFIPYAALSPFHTWIFPKRHSASFSGITEEEIREIAVSLKTLLTKLFWGLDDPDYNLVISSSRPQDMGNEYSHWYLTIIPRISQTAGFELGSGMFINPSLPEKSAEFLKSVHAS